MTNTLTCPNCQHRFHPPTDHEGARLPCPRCEHLIAVGGGPEDFQIDKPAAQRPTEETSEVEIEPDEDAPRIKKRGFEPCPRCGAEEARRVHFTFWGSFYVTNLLHHVRCPRCRHTYNGLTGRSNLPWAILCVSIPLLVIGCLLGYIGYRLYLAM